MRTDRKSLGFPPIAEPDARTLILGTLPGEESLLKGEYYANPRNAFWRIMGELIGAERDLEYQHRVARLTNYRIAVWDVCKAAARSGSRDASIESSSVIVNDFRTFLGRHSRISLICFNGCAARDLYRRKVAPFLSEPQKRIQVVTLPSTSPACASISYAQKLDRWSVVIQEGLGQDAANRTDEETATGKQLRQSQEVAKRLIAERYAHDRLRIDVHEEMPRAASVYRTWPEGDYRYVTVSDRIPQGVGGSASLYVLDKASNLIIASARIIYE